MSVRNAEPETVSLAVLDACERAARDVSPDYDDAHDKDAQFMHQAMANLKSRLRVLKHQAAAAWKPEFCNVLERCHSISVDQADYEEKEGVRTQKMKCMACGRWEHCCKYALHGLGFFKASAFNNGATNTLQKGWNDFIEEYNHMHDDDYVDYTRRNNLPLQDMGTYTVGATCLRKAELYYMINTAILECCYEAHIAYKEAATKQKDTTKLDKPFTWVYAIQENVDGFMKKIEELELSVADERRPIPEWGTDQGMWEQVEKARMKAAGGDQDERLRLLRERADRLLKQEQSIRHPPESEDEDEEDQSDQEDDSAQPRLLHARHRGAHTRTMLESDEDADDAEVAEHCAPPVAAKKREKRKSYGKQPARSSRRQRNLSPEEAVAFVKGPRNEGRTTSRVCRDDLGDVDKEVDTASDEEAGNVELPSESIRTVRGLENPMRMGSRRPGPNAMNMAGEQRAPWGRLPARRNALFNLGTLQLKLLREGRDDDSAVCTNAMFTIQELLRKVDELEHSPHL